MKTDSYLGKTDFYDTFVGPLTKRLRKMLLKMASPETDRQVLEVGCGTGLNLRRFQVAGYHVHGLDLSHEMIHAADQRLQGRACLTIGDAAKLPYPDHFFDHVVIMLVLHEMASTSRLPVLKEAIRVLKRDGRLLIVDYHPEPLQSAKGWFFKIAILMIERFAGKRHFYNYKNYIIHNGLFPLIKTGKLSVVQKQTAVGGNIIFYCLKKSMAAP